ncbi:putative sporulation protein YtxC [Moorellaceae bacterium AZ2]
MTILLASARSLDVLIIRLASLLGNELSLRQWNTGGFNFCQCSFTLGRKQLPGKARKRWEEELAAGVAAFIIEVLEEDLLEKIICNQYEIEEKQEARQLCSRAKKILEQGEKAYPGSYWRGEALVRRLKEYLQENSYLNIDGFVQFRLPDYLMELERAAEEAVEEYIVEKEYDEFICVLKYFVEIQEPRVERVHVVLTPKGGFQLYDGENRSLERDYLEGFVVDMGDSELNYYEDLLLSALITLAPRQIILHGSEKGKARGITHTIKNVFGERVRLCNGCNRCRQPLHKF